MTDKAGCAETVYHSQGNWGSRYACENTRGLSVDTDGKVRCCVHNLAKTAKRTEARRKRFEERVAKKHCPSCRCF